LDETAEEIRWYDIAHIAKNSPCTITLHSDGIQSFTLQSGAHVTISGVQGIDPKTVFPLEVVDKDRCSIPVDRTLAADHEQGGVLTEVKLPRVCEFASYEESWKDAKCMQTDIHEIAKSREIHTIRLTLDHFKSAHGRFPSLSNADDLEESMQLATALFPGTEVREKEVKTAIQAAGQYLHPAGLNIAGLVTAEVLKYSGQGTPLPHWMYVDWRDLASPYASEVTHCRLMLVGNSAISSEIRRLLAFLPIFSSGLVLSKPEELLPKNDSAYSDELWESLNFVLIASTKKAEIKHAAERCVWFEKPHVIFNSSGTKGTVQVVIPHKTQTYTESQTWSQEGYISNLKPLNGKATTEGCIYSAFNELQSVFQTQPEKALEFLKDPTGVSANIGELERLGEFLERLGNVEKYEDCVKWACAFCQFHLYGQMEQVREYMEERRGEIGLLDYRRMPVPVVLDWTVFEHYRLVELLAEQCATMFSLPAPLEPISIGQYLPRTIEDWPLPVSPSVTPNILPYSDLISRIRPILFSETDEKLCEMIRIFACLKARIFSIPEPSQAKTKAVLSPFLPTHPALSILAAGTGLLEVLKVVYSRAFSTLRNSLFSLVQPLFLSLPPLPCVQIYSKPYDPVLMGPVIALPEGHTAWDKFATMENCPFTYLFAYFRANYALDVVMVSSGTVMLYNKYIPQRHPETVDLQIHEVYRRKGKKDCLEGRKSLELTVACETEKGDSVEIPAVRYLLPSA